MVQNEIKKYFINFLNKKGKKSKTEKLYLELLLDLKKKIIIIQIYYFKSQ